MLAFLAACGGGGGPDGPPPPPSGGTPAPTPPSGQPDTLSPAPGSGTATGNVLSNDSAGAVVVSIAVQGGVSGTVGQALQGKLGQLTIQQNGTFAYEIGAGSGAFTALAEGQTATETFIYAPSVGGTAGALQTLIINVTGVNDTPTTLDDRVNTTGEGDPVTGNVLANDADPDAGAQLSVTTVRAGTGQAAQSVQSERAVGLPTVVGKFGTLTMQSDGSYSYAVDPNDPDFVGIGSGETAAELFTYTVSDGKASTTATLTIMVAGRVGPPEATIDTASVTEDTANSTVTGNALSNDKGGTGTPKVVSVNGAPLSGQIIETAYGRFAIASDGSFTYTLDNSKTDTNGLFAGATPTESFIYEIADSTGRKSSAQILITITGANDAPTAVADAAALTEDGFPSFASGSVTSNDSDPDGGTLVVTKIGAQTLGPDPDPGAGAGGGYGGKVAFATGVYGSLYIQDNGVFSYTLRNDDPDTDALIDGQVAFDDFTYTVIDNQGGTSTATLRITVSGRSFGATSGDDNLAGTMGADSIAGLSGDDVIQGLGGGDTINGGSGSDTASYASSATGVDVYLSGRLANGRGDAAGDLLTSIENITGSAFDDDLEGDAGVNRISAAGGDDNVAGLAGADVLDGGAQDFADFVDYMASDAGVVIDLMAGTGSGGHAEGDLLSNFEAVSGSQFDDILRGTNGNDILFANLGDDIVEGRGGDDDVRGNVGADRLDGGDGTDVVFYTSSTVGVEINLATGIGRFGHAEGDILISIENIVGSNHNDLLISGADANRLRGWGGSDTVSYVASNAGVNVDLSAGTASGGYAAGDVLEQIADLTGSAFNDTLTGSTAANVLEGGRGVDSLSGGAGADRFRFSELTTSDDRDVITDFQGGQDKIALDASAFAPTFTFSNTAPTAGGAWLVYNMATGVLSYDADGNGVGGAIEIAILSGAPALQASDIIVA